MYFLCIPAHAVQNVWVFICKTGEGYIRIICTQVSDVRYLEAQALLLGFLGFQGAGGGAVQGTAAASCRTELAAFPEHLHLTLSALRDENKKVKCQKHRSENHNTLTLKA